MFAIVSNPGVESTRAEASVLFDYLGSPELWNTTGPKVSLLADDASCLSELGEALSAQVLEGTGKSIPVFTDWDSLPSGTTVIGPSEEDYVAPAVDAGHVYLAIDQGLASLTVEEDPEEGVPVTPDIPADGPLSPGLDGDVAEVDTDDMEITETGKEENEEVSKEETKLPSNNQAVEPKRGRGRPRKNPIEPVADKAPAEPIVTAPSPEPVTAPAAPASDETRDRLLGIISVYLREAPESVMWDLLEELVRITR